MSARSVFVLEVGYSFVGQDFRWCDGLGTALSAGELLLEFFGLGSLALLVVHPVPPHSVIAFLGDVRHEW